MALTSIRVRTDKKEYCPYEDDKQVIQVRIIPSPAAEAEGLTANVALIRNGVTIHSWDVVLTDNAYTATTLDITTLRDHETKILPVKDGKYTLQVTVGAMLQVTETIYISLVTVDQMRKIWCKGATLLDAEILMPRQQPKNITGVTVLEVSFGTKPGKHTLAYDSTEKSLSWSNGAAVEIPAEGGQMILMDDMDEDYIVAEVADELLPGTSCSDSLAIDYATMTDDNIRKVINLAKTWMEEQLHVPVEPITIATEERDGETVDKIVDAVSYIRPYNAANWFTIDLPYNCINKLERLEGWFNKTKITSIDDSWIVLDRKSGQIELVPSYGAMINWMLYGPVLSRYFMGYHHIPEFWHYKLSYGLTDLSAGEHGMVLEAIAKKAACDILTIAGQAYRAGYSSESTGRDGISDSQSYTSSAVYGIYSATIDEYKEWLKNNVEGGRLRRKIIGIQMVVI